MRAAMSRKSLRRGQAFAGLLLALALALSMALDCQPAQAQAGNAMTIPVPEPRPDTVEDTNQARTPAKEGDGASDATPFGGTIEAQPPAPEDPDELARCEAALANAGVRFERLATISDGNGCGVAAPYRISEIAPGIRLHPETELRCEAALATARWVRNAVLPAAATFRPDARLTAIRHASTYVCRGRNNQAGARLSQHALGNAIDIAAFEFEDATSVSIQPRDRDADMAEAFQKAVRFAACLHFTTVIGPYSDPWHADHLHLDIAPRNGGYRLCRFPEMAAETPEDG